MAHISNTAAGNGYWEDGVIHDRNYDNGQYTGKTTCHLARRLGHYIDRIIGSLPARLGRQIDHQEEENLFCYRLTRRQGAPKIGHVLSELTADTATTLYVVHTRSLADP